MIKAITTFSAAGYEQYGRRMVDTFNQYWQIPLTVYQEGFKISNGVDLNVPWQTEFKRRNSYRKFADFRFDAVRFSHKVAAVTEAARDCDYLIWLDGDVFTHKTVSMADTTQWLPADDEYISWLWRDKLYPEMGFYVLNVNHPQHKTAMNNLVNYYADDSIYKLEQWHDCWVFREVIKNLGVKWKSLSGGYEWHSHPFINGPLGEFMDHAKGNRKAQGKSNASDFVKGKK
jgi:hypothetical protein